jgi:hypothetical protein
MTNQKSNNTVDLEAMVDKAQTQEEIKEAMAEIDRQLDPLQQWRQGYDQGMKTAVASINEMTGHGFKDVVEVILYLRRHA